MLSFKKTFLRHLKISSYVQSFQWQVMLIHNYVCTHAILLTQALSFLGSLSDMLLLRPRHLPLPLLLPQLQRQPLLQQEQQV